jgi:ArsR family transcriptional regulator
MKDLQPKRCARLLRVLAEPERLRIIQCLRLGPRNVGDLAEVLGKHVAKVSHHLSVLRQAGLVEDLREGRHIIYSLHPEVYRPCCEGETREHLDLGCCRLEMPPD